jgi:hypothetical protein
LQCRVVQAETLSFKQYPMDPPKRAGVTIPEEIAAEARADRFREDAVVYERATFESRMVGAWTQLPFLGDPYDAVASRNK